MESLAIIPARGGSKRIPKKNIKEFCGKPIIAYSIEAAMASEIFDEVMVSTDDAEIASLAKKYGASVPFLRSDKTSGDFATQRDVLLEVYEQYKNIGRSFEMFGCIYSTAPFITAEVLRKAYLTLCEQDAGAVFPVVKFDYPPQRAYVVRDGFLTYEFPDYALARSQDLEPIYHDCGQFYLYRTKAFLEKKGTMIEKVVPFVYSSDMVQDIDTLEDWKMAELKYQMLMRKE